jgi:hypothetical protein
VPDLLVKHYELPPSPALETGPTGIRGPYASAVNPCGGKRKALANLLANVW